MFTSTIILAGTVVVEGKAFRWSVTDGRAQHLTVTHPTLGTQTQPLTASPDSQARAIGRGMVIAALGFLEAVDDTPMPEGDPESPIV